MAESSYNEFELRFIVIIKMWSSETDECLYEFKI